MKKTLLLAAVAAFSLAACGQDSSKSGAAKSPAPSATPPATSTPAPSAEPKKDEMKK